MSVSENGQRPSPSSPRHKGDSGPTAQWPDRVGLVHDWLPVYGGAERVLEQMIEVFPDSTIYSLIESLPEDQRAFLQGKSVETSFMQSLPFRERAYRYYLPLAPFAIEQFDLSAHDVVVSSSYAVAKGALIRSDQLHISYVHSPIRYAWDLYHEYLEADGLSQRLRNLLARPILHYMRLFDVCTAPRVDVFVANSQHVARRIWKRYRRHAHVVYPPVNVSRFSVQRDKDDFYLTMSRLVSYKQVDLVVRAFNEMPDKQLYVIGDGPERDRIERLAGPNVEVLGYQPDEAVTHYMENARAFVFAAEEDFGIVPVEAQACGTPVIAYGRGGTTETVVPGETGLFFQQQEVDAIQETVAEFENVEPELRAGEIRAHAEQFDVSAFRSAFSDIVGNAYSSFRSGGQGASVPSTNPDGSVAIDRKETLT